jgi:hypothetical protein
MAKKESNDVYVIGVDPGRTTGIAIFKNGEFDTGFEIKKYLEVGDCLEAYKPEAVVCEYFSGATKVSYYEALFVIGIVQYVCRRNKCKYVKQYPAMLQAYRDEAMDMTKSKHIQSAIAHVLYYMRPGSVNEIRMFHGRAKNWDNREILRDGKSKYLQK